MDTSVKITLKGKTFNASFPNIGQEIQIEGSKLTLTEGKYPIMALAPMATTKRALDIADAVAYFAALFGDELFALYGVSDIKNFMELNRYDIDEMVNEYLTKYEPFYEGIIKRTDRKTRTQEKKEKK